MNRREGTTGGGTTSKGEAAAASRVQRRPSARLRRDTATAWLFIAPAVLIIAVFGVFPLFFTGYLSLFNWRLRPGPFLGLGNFAEALGPSAWPVVGFVAAVAGIVGASVLLRRDESSGGSRTGSPRRRVGAALAALCALLAAACLSEMGRRGDPDVFASLRVTAWYALLTVPFQLAGGLALALLLTRKLAGRQAFRVIYLLPYVAPTVATATVFELLFSLQPQSFANRLLSLAGAHPLQWLQEPSGVIPLLFGARGLSESHAWWALWAQGPSLALATIVLYSWWVFIGYYALIYINGLSAIPRQLYEAAEVDGAGAVRRFFSITVPLLSPTTYFLTLLGVIGTFKAFTQLYVLRSAAAAGTTDSVSVEVFFTFFRKARLGYASAIALVLFVIVLALTLVQQRTLERGVTYGD
ncbi:MAG TPA: sugar ABC transporter permease [bacterium]|nr:sugar ABC transporter permease [bacterium]